MMEEIHTEPVLTRYVYVNKNDGREIPCDYTEPVLSRYKNDGGEVP